MPVTSSHAALASCPCTFVDRDDITCSSLGYEWMADRVGYKPDQMYNNDFVVDRFHQFLERFIEADQPWSLRAERKVRENDRKKDTRRRKNRERYIELFRHTKYRRGKPLPDIVDDTAFIELLSEFRDLVASWDPKMRDVFYLRRVEGISLAGLSRRFNCSQRSIYRCLEEAEKRKERWLMQQKESGR